ncbi:multidrug effflux MFS transporter [Pseudomonas sp. JBR1]|uniref:multidrug effflux MFS transporter n=1 Tax=Pseudomonas sp. JBR1 TaxID=3020907 RepID=UPI0023056994|nr:multidrug effflux MFS transporter [Pseudomonas sp. JBR1]WCE09035.1 multidrug effflux MFS transporter [Pseudomonas sp. JBR1]
MCAATRCSSGTKPSAGATLSPERRAPRQLWLLALLAAFVPLSIDTYLPSLPNIAREFDTSSAQVQLTIGVFLVGLCLGMLVYGPLSDRFGRKRLLLGCILLYMLASLGCMASHSVEQLIGWRFLQALGGAGAMVLARTVVRDLYSLNEAARVLSLMHVIAMLATLVAPLLGTYLVLLGDWRSIFAALLLVAGGCLIAVYGGLPESHQPSERTASIGASFALYGRVAVDPLALCYILSMGLSVGGMFAFITASPFVFIDYFGFSPRAYSLLFALNLGGIILATVINARSVRRHGPLYLLSIGSRVAAAAGLSLILAGLVGGQQPWAVMAGVWVFVGISGLIGANCTASLMALFPRNAGAAVGLAISLQYVCAAGVSGLVAVLADGTPLAMCLAIGACGIGSALCYQAIQRLHRRRLSGTAPAY